MTEPSARHPSRLRIRVRTSADSLPWRRLLKSGRGLIYDALARSAPDLATRLHDHGWRDTRMVPFGYGPPVFPSAAKRRGVYPAGGPGYFDVTSPVPEILEAAAKGFADQSIIDWGGTALHVEGFEAVAPPDFSEGRALMRTAVPVVMKGSGLGPDGKRTTRQAWLLPSDQEFAACFTGNLRRKATALGLPDDVKLEDLPWTGSRRTFAVGKGAIPGALLEAQLSGAPETLQAIWSWGLGQNNTTGFGQVVA
ncbi:CRISPR-associated endoribonuclease Cas6 [Nocardiopsis composta]|uniref:CRISPR-associated endoribonuclease Cas6 n=1 Tax=Nocardiopsis composta TaxID=157465 RepID=A0A7W8QK46_9ACTN|nr:CRISPR-associated endoribonuclease Cas6 [Nocardiopsis composta]MBB5431283.1 CRISPR-associated endoribonuclease Cas6 [Nocardiopsis composta]